MSPTNQTLLSRFAVAASVFALIIAAFAVVSSGSSDGDSGGSAAAGPVTVDMVEFAFNPATVTVPVGGSLNVTNSGTMAHNLEVVGQGLTTPDVPAGESAILDVSSLAPGEYEIICTIAGHEQSGMTGTLIVSEDGAGAETAAPGEAGEHAGHGDIGSLTPGSAEAEDLNRRLEEAMTAGVNEYLALAEEYAAGNIERGNEVLEPEILDDGTKRFEITAAITDWQVNPGNVVKAWTYNGMVPGPYIKVDLGDKVQIALTNEMPVSTDMHLHGVSVPFEMDGVAPITQPYIQPGETFVYEFTAGDKPELGMYHAHMHGHQAIVNGQFAAIQIGEMDLPRGREFHTMTVPEDLEISQEIPMVLNDAGVIGLSLNGKAFPETEPIVAERGDWVLMHYYNEGLTGHPMHLHRQPQLVVAKDGFPLAEPYQIDTLWVSPGERYSVLVEASEPGIWAFHCHMVNHAEDENGFMGMVTTMIVNPVPGSE